MSDAHHGSSPGGDIDLSQFYQIFFEEAGENLDQMEQTLLNVNVEAADDEELNAIFRCAHSIKGGAATFGFSDVAELTHQMESLLDKLRRHELQPTAPMVDVLLESADALRGLLARHQGVEGDPPPTGGLVARIRDLAEGGSGVPAAAAPASAPAPAPVATATVVATQPVVEVHIHPAAPAPAPAGMPKPSVPGATRCLEILIGPLDQPEQADALAELFRDIPGLGTIAGMPSPQAGIRAFAVETTSTDEDLLDLFVFHVNKDQVVIREAGGAAAVSEPEATPAAAAVHDEAVDHSFGFFDNAPGLPGNGPTAAPAAVAAAAAAPTPVATPAPVAARAPEAAPAPVAAPATPHPRAASAAASAESSTIRVAISKVDQLINLVGELVITQAMLAQNSSTLDPVLNQQLMAGLADLDRNTRDLQESVMSIRMIPMSVVFSRFPRMLRDLAGKLGKKVELVTQGEATELDKGLVEKITDPLTHLVRNSCDHGIELPDERIARGKSPHGTITLAASHQGGSIVIEVRDDGKGMSREKILSKARERGLDVNDQMTDAEVWQLIFAPGFSTADVVTDVSGRGVGMDVVKRNIAAMNGTVEIESAEGYGMRVSVRLPLTLAIMDGMSVGVGSEVYILPLSSVVESFQVKGNEVSTVGQDAQLVKVRDEYMPVISLERAFHVPRESEKTSDMMVVVEAEGSRVALLVDELLGQQQVVVKNLETNYRKVPNVSGATILGDGKVALILDTAALVRRSRH